jgi:hypothetical protein
VVAVGADSGRELPCRGGLAVAERLGTEPVTLPGHHGGYLPVEYGMGSDPAGFAVALRKVLDES